MLKLFRTKLPKKGEVFKNEGQLLTQDKSEISQVSKMCLNILVGLQNNIVVAWKWKLELVLDIYRNSALFMKTKVPQQYVNIQMWLV